MKKTTFTDTFIKKLHPESKKYTKDEWTGDRIKLEAAKDGKELRCPRHGGDGRLLTANQP